MGRRGTFCYVELLSLRDSARFHEVVPLSHTKD